MKKNLLFNCFLMIVVLFLTGSSSFSDENYKKSVMLAKKWMPEIDVHGWWLSEKLDGVRGCWSGKVMTSRSGRRLDIPVWFTKKFPPFPLDGELWIDRKSFSEIISIVNRKGDDKAWENVRYYIFDVPIKELPFEKRIAMAEKWFENNPSSYGKILSQKICRGKQHLADELRKIEMAGGEGIMLRRPGSYYSAGRSSDILKVKTFHDAEAVVVKHIKGKGRNRNRMGSVEVELPNGKRFFIGSGFTDADRENPPPIGSIITFKYKEFNKSGIPRFATYLRVKQKL